MDDELQEMKSLPRETEPPPHIQAAIAAELRRSRRFRRARWPLAVAAAIAMAIIGLIALRQHPTTQANYILLLYETPDFKGGSRAEYSAWAQQMRPLIVGGEELDLQPILTIHETPANPRLAGYFLVNAPDEATAVRVARQCPHVKHGGGIALRRIE